MVTKTKAEVTPGYLGCGLEILDNQAKLLECKQDYWTDGTAKQASYAFEAGASDTKKYSQDKYLDGIQMDIEVPIAHNASELLGLASSVTLSSNAGANF